MVPPSKFDAGARKCKQPKQHFSKLNRAQRSFHYIKLYALIGFSFVNCSLSPLRNNASFPHQRENILPAFPRTCLMYNAFILRPANAMFVYNVTSSSTQNTYSQATQMHTHIQKVTSSSKRGPAGSRRFLVNYCTRCWGDTTVKASLHEKVSPHCSSGGDLRGLRNYLYIQVYTQRKKAGGAPPRWISRSQPNHTNKIYTAR